MICNICGKNEFVFVRKYSEPDKHERLVGLEKPVCRAWWKCGHCGFHKATRSYPLSLLTGICKNGYGEKIAESENKQEISCTHILECVEDPEDFLCKVGDCLVDGGRLFITVPDAKEFAYLPADHDEFNSCCVSFFTPETLMWLVRDAGFNVTDLHMVRTKAQGLSRIMLSAEKV